MGDEKCGINTQKITSLEKRMTKEEERTESILKQMSEEGRSMSRIEVWIEHMAKTNDAQNNTLLELTKQQGDLTQQYISTVHILEKMNDSLDNMNDKIEHTNQRVDGLEGKFYKSEDKNKIDTRDIIGGWIVKILSLGGLWYILKEGFQKIGEFFK